MTLEAGYRGFLLCKIWRGQSQGNVGAKGQGHRLQPNTATPRDGGRERRGLSVAGKGGTAFQTYWKKERMQPSMENTEWRECGRGIILTSPWNVLWSLAWIVSMLHKPEHGVSFACADQGSETKRQAGEYVPCWDSSVSLFSPLQTVLWHAWTCRSTENSLCTQCVVAASSVVSFQR